VVLALLAVAVAGGELGRRRLPRDAIPDLSDPQIVLVTEWMGRPASEVAEKVTAVLTRELGGIPGSAAIRGSSMSGMSFVDVVFAPGASLARGRTEILERAKRARPRLPPDARVTVGPEASSTGWIYQYVIVDPARRNPLVARRFQDELLRPALAAVPGVVEVASVGGAIEELVVRVEPARLSASGLAFSDLLPALRTAGVAEPALTATALGSLSVGAPPRPSSEPGAPRAVRLGDVADVRVSSGMAGGLADYGGGLPVVGGIVIARRDADVPSVVAGVERVLDDMRPRLPAGARLVTVYDRSGVAERVGGTLFRALAEEIAAVVLVILLFLLHGRSALVPMVSLPAVLLLTFAGMYALGIPATVMSLGGIAIALGMAVDADVVALEACHRRLEAGGNRPFGGRREAILAAAGAFAPAILTSLMIAALAFLPVLAFSGESGRLLRPLALTKTLVVAAAALVTLTAAPALRDRLLRGRIVPELANPLTRRLLALYRPFVAFALARPIFTLATAALAVASCLPLLSRLGGEFLPRLDEGDLLFMPTTASGVSMDDAAMGLTRFDRVIGEHPEVATVFGKVGRADTATDPAPLSMAEITVQLRPRADWPARARSRWYSSWAPAPVKRWLSAVWPEREPLSPSELLEKLGQASQLPGWTGGWTAPVRARMDMMSTGVRTPLAIRVIAPDPARLDALAATVRSLVEPLPGTKSVVAETLGGETRVELVVDRAALARHHVPPEIAASTAGVFLAGGQLADVDRGGRRQRLRIEVGPVGQRAAEQIGELTVRGDRPFAQPVPLALLGTPRFVRAPSVIRSEGGESVAYVHVDLQERIDVGRWVERARQELGAAEATGTLSFQANERIEWGGQYQLLAAGQRRLAIIVPLVIVSMMLLLLLLFRSATEALIVLASVPFALVGSFWTLFLLGYPLSAPVWVGLLSVVGLAMQTGVVMVVYIDDAFHRRMRQGRIHTRNDIVEAHAEGTVRRLRPKLMTIATMAAGLIPLLWAEGAGAEIMKRVAAPMLGGLATSAFLTLEVLPVLYTLWRYRQLRRAQRTGRSLAAVVGRPPRWARS
jgi:Cu(I)/Ag(I) efflux system membrane protein CusA/SilA